MLNDASQPTPQPDSTPVWLSEALGNQVHFDFVINFLPEPPKPGPVPDDPEQWRVIPGYINYQASTKGRIRNWITGHIYSTKAHPEGYVRVSLKKNGKWYTERIHELVALAFLGPAPLPGMIVGHADENKSNNVLSNLHWITQSQNAKDSHKMRKRKKASHG